MVRSLKRIALVVTSGTLLSKAGGLVRQLVIASAFGVGAAYDAYNYAYILPGFLLVLLGGINGPFHSAMVSGLSRRPDHERAHIFAALNSIASAVLLIITAILFFAADPLISVLGPGLNIEIHKIAVIQLQIMAPIALLAGLIGLGFGSLNASNEFWIPAISPLMSSIAIVIGLGIFQIQTNQLLQADVLSLKGGITLAVATLTGALLQLFVQIPALIKQRLASIKIVFDWNHPGVKEVLRIIGPATISSGMLQINVCIDLFFASGIVGAAAGLGYASLLIQAPLGLISNALLVPLFPTFAKLAASGDNPALISRLRQGLLISSTSMVGIGAVFIALGNEIVSLIYERGAFDNQAVSVVSGLLIAYGIGMPAYLGRDLLVRFFYAIGDAATPLKVSIISIVLNITFDWSLIGGPTPWGKQLPFNLGAPGLVLATAAVNFISCAALIFALNQKLNGLPLRQWSFDGLKVLFAGIISGSITWALKTQVLWPQSLLGLIFEILLSGMMCIALFSLISSSLGIKEVQEPLIMIRKKFMNH